MKDFLEEKIFHYKLNPYDKIIAEEKAFEDFKVVFNTKIQGFIAFLASIWFTNNFMVYQVFLLYKNQVVNLKNMI